MGVSGGGCEATPDQNATRPEHMAKAGVQAVTADVHTAVGNVGTSEDTISTRKEPTEVLLMARDAVSTTDVSLDNVMVATIEVISEESTTALSTTETAQPTDVLAMGQPLSTEIACCTNPVIHTSTDTDICC